MPEPVPVAPLPLEASAALLTGAGFWSTSAVDQSPAVVLSDGPHGVRRQKHGTDHLGLHHSEPATCFPLAVAVGSSWSTDVSARIGAALAAEARSLGVGVLLGPGVNLKRSPLGGRNFEYYSEDPLLTGVLATAYVRALQAGGVGASLKHFAANDQETDRMVISSDVDERTLREVYLAPFERVVRDAAPASVMCSYNRINGVYAAENAWLLTGVLRTEWGYDGVVVSDWGAVHDRVDALIAGLDLAMPGPGETQTASIVAAVEQGRLDRAVVDSAAARVAELATRHQAAPAAVDFEAHHELARELAGECAVLLKNEQDVLPLGHRQRILVVGEFAVEPRFQGGGSSHVNATRVDAPLEGIRRHGAGRGSDVVFERGFDTAQPESDAALRHSAVTAAADADVCVIFAGTAEADESEGFDRTGIRLAETQAALIRAVAAGGRPTVVVLSHGGVLSLEEWHDDVDAILEGFLLGQGGGDALAAILFGDISPSGHLAETIPRRLEDTPAYLSFPGEQGHVRYAEGVMVGYRHFVTTGAPVRYPFGHGLSYTSYASSDLVVSGVGPDAISVRVTVANTGDRVGKHVVQAYLATDAGPVRRPARVLAAFEKVLLEPGESRVVELAIDRRVLAYWDIEYGDFVVAPGRYTVQIAADAATVLLEAEVELSGDDLAPTISLQSSVGEWLAHPTAGPAVGSLLAALVAQAAQRGGDAAQVAAAVDDATGLPDAITTMPMVQLVAVAGGAIDAEWLTALAAGTAAEGETR